MKIQIHTDPETVDLISVQISAWLFGFFTGVAASLCTWWLIRGVWG